MTKLGFTLAGAGHPIIPVMLGEAPLAQAMAAKMLERGIYVIGFSFPGRAQGPGAHPHADVGGAPFDDIDRAMEAFAEVGRELGVI